MPFRPSILTADPIFDGPKVLLYHVLYRQRGEEYISLDWRSIYAVGKKDRFAFRQAAILFLLLSYGGVENRGLEYSGPDFHTQQFVKPTYQTIQNVRP